MSAHMKTHHTKKNMFEIVLIYPDKTRRHSFVPSESAGRIEAILRENDEDDFIDWRIVAKDNLAKRKKAGVVLRGARYREDMSQKELAKLSGVSQENISRIENGKRVVGEKLAKKLAKPLKINYLLLLEAES